MTLYQHEMKNAYIGEVWTPGSNTLAYLPLNGDGNDYSGNNKNLTSSGTTSYTTVGGVLSANFGGSNYLYNSSLTCSSIGQTFTIAGWFYSDNQIGITCMGKSGNLWHGWGVYYETGLLGRIRAETQNNNTPTRFMPSIAYVEGWHHIVFTHNSSGGAVYYDGVSKQTGSMPMDYDGYLAVGALLDSTIYYQNGNVSNVILENKVWTAEEISHYYDITKSNYGY